MNHPCPSRKAPRLASRTFVAALLGFAAYVPAQTTVTVPCTRDNTLYESATGALSNGAGPGLFVGVTGQPGLRRALVYFDIAANVPAGARIVSAELSVNVAQSRYAAPLEVRGHRVLQSWGEGTSVSGGGGGGGALATAGDATWLHRVYPTTLWSNAGGDFAAAPSFIMDSPQFGLATSDTSGALLADVQSFRDNPAQNFGWLLKTDEAQASASRRLDSRENQFGTPPVLVVTYLTNGQSAPLGQGCLVNGQPFTCGLVGAPIGGTTVQLTQSNGPAGNAAVNMISLSFDPVGFPLLPQCPLLLPFGPGLATYNLLVLDGAGSGSTSIAIAPGYPGLLLAAQTAAVDSNPAGFVLSNARILLLQ